MDNTCFINTTSDGGIFYLAINNYPLIMIFWNIFLLSIPFFLCKKLIELFNKTKFKKRPDKIKALLIAFFWLIFAPNAPYIMTDMRHISNFCPNNYYQICPENAWMITFFFLYSIIGWIAFVFLVNQMKPLVAKIWGKMGVSVYLWLISPVFSLGVLLGLINRLNSWDIVINPTKVINSTLLYFTDWTYLKNLLIYTFFLYIAYFAGDILFKTKINLKK